MDLSKTTQKVQEALQQAQVKALRYGHQEVDAEHVLFALLDQEGGLVPRLIDYDIVVIEGADALQEWA